MLQYVTLLHFRTPPRVRVRATVRLSVAFFHDESSIAIGGYESAIASTALLHCRTPLLLLMTHHKKTRLKALP